MSTRFCLAKAGEHASEEPSKSPIFTLPWLNLGTGLELIGEKDVEKPDLQNYITTGYSEHQDALKKTVKAVFAPHLDRIDGVDGDQVEWITDTFANGKLLVPCKQPILPTLPTRLQTTFIDYWEANSVDSSPSFSLFLPLSSRLHRLKYRTNPHDF